MLADVMPREYTRWPSNSRLTLYYFDIFHAAFAYIIWLRYDDADIDAACNSL